MKRPILLAALAIASVSCANLQPKPSGAPEKDVTHPQHWRTAKVAGHQVR